MTRHNFLAIFCIAVFSCGVVTADETVAESQRNLKLQGFYFGEADGRVNEETLAAVKRFQIRSGLPVTGNLDAATLQELAKKAVPATPAAETPESLREIARTQEKSDREFLLRTEAAERAGTDTPTQPRSSELPPQVRPATKKDTVKPVRPLVAEIHRYIERYLDAAEAPTPEKEVSFYADRVDYFDSGRVSREFVRKDQLKYYDRWPQRSFELIDEPHIEWLDEQRATVRFKLRYALSNESKRAQGVTENLVTLRIHEERMEIVGIRERKLKD